MSNPATSENRVFASPTSKPKEKEKAKEPRDEDEYDLPAASVVKAAKKDLPPALPLAKEAKTALLKSAKMFIHFLTACSNDIAQNDNKSTVTVDHVLKALEEMEVPSQLRQQVVDYMQNLKNEEQQKRQKRKDPPTSLSTKAQQPISALQQSDSSNTLPTTQTEPDFSSPTKKQNTGSEG